MKRNGSVSVAKDRLRVLLVSDRMNCTPDTLQNIQNDLYHTLSKYMEIIPENFEVQMNTSHIYIKLIGDNK